MAATLPVIATPSRTETAARCYRRHCVPDLLHLESPNEDNANLAFGTVIHAGAAAHWRGEDALLAVQEEYVKEYSALEGDKKHTQQLAEFMIGTYVKEAQLAGGYWGQEDAEIVAVEQRLTPPVEHGQLSFQIDRLIRVGDEYVLVDTKTASRMAAAWEKPWPQSLQMKLYAYGVWRAYGKIPTVFIEGCLKGVPSTIKYLQLPQWSSSILEEAAQLVSYFLQKDSDIVGRFGDDLDAMADFIMTKTDFSISD